MWEGRLIGSRDSSYIPERLCWFIAARGDQIGRHARSRPPDVR